MAGPIAQIVKDCSDELSRTSSIRFTSRWKLTVENALKVPPNAMLVGEALGSSLLSTKVTETTWGI